MRVVGFGAGVSIHAERRFDCLGDHSCDQQGLQWESDVSASVPEVCVALMAVGGASVPAVSLHLLIADKCNIDSSLHLL